MSFLKNPIEYQFARSSKLAITKYNYRVHGINLTDLAEINRILKRIDPELKLTMAESFMRGKFIQFIDDSFRQYQYKDNEQWKLKIRIQGFKTSSSGRKSPILRIEVAQLCYIANLN